MQTSRRACTDAAPPIDNEDATPDLSRAPGATLTPPCTAQSETPKPQPPRKGADFGEICKLIH